MGEKTTDRDHLAAVVRAVRWGSKAERLKACDDAEAHMDGPVRPAGVPDPVAASVPEVEEK